MTDFTRTYAIIINAPVHAVFEYCRDPRHLFQGWPGIEVTEVTMTLDGVGTTAHIEGRFFKGLVTEDVLREFVEVVPDERIVSRAHVKMRMFGRSAETDNGPVITWLFDPEDGGTKLSFVILEEDLALWQRLSESVSAVVDAKSVRSMLAAIKAGAESEAAPAA
jgi:uncharacterized protein YndB with AHSA1/START domain